MADTLRRVLESGKISDEQCFSMLRGLVSDKVVGGCTSEKGIEEKAVIRLDNRKSLLQLLDMRNLSDEESHLLLRQLDEPCSCNSLTEFFEGLDAIDRRYRRQIADSEGFDIDPGVRIPRLEGISPFYFGEKEEQPPLEMVLYGRLAVHWFNFEHNRNLKFIRIPKLNTQHPFSVSYYITVEVKDKDVDDAADSSPSLTLQTIVRRDLFPLMQLFIDCCRIKPTTEAEKEVSRYPNFFVSYGVDEFYRGCMPTFLSGPPEEAADDQRFYEVQERFYEVQERFYEVQDEDIAKNDWLLLYTHFALFQVCEAGSHSFLPEEMELKKILVQTRETQYTEPAPILKSMNAIFHISFRANCCDYTSVVRRTTDCISGHMCLEVDTR